MPLGTPPFVGGRLRQAREARGLTALALADLIGTSRQAVSQYEIGEHTPRPEVLEAICKTLNHKPEWFFIPLREEPEPIGFARSMASTSKTARLRVMARLRWLWEFVLPYLRQFVSFPSVNFPDLDLPKDILTITPDTIEDAATKVRYFWGHQDGPISNVAWLLERNGAVVVRLETGDDTLDSMSCWHNGVPYVILGTENGSAARSRFDASHELAHLILHRHIDDEVFARPREHRILEAQANRFAGAFLLPATGFMLDVYMPTLSSLRALKPRWGVSIAAMIHRCQDLEMINPDQGRRLWVSYTRNGWRHREPYDDEMPTERPRLQSEAIDLIVSNSVQTKDDVVAHLPTAVADLEQVTMVANGYFDEPAPLVRLRDYEKAEKSPREQSTSGTIVRFPKASSP